MKHKQEPGNGPLFYRARKLPGKFTGASRNAASGPIKFPDNGPDKLSGGARFSKVPVTSGPDNLSGPLSGNFIGPDVAFLEAPVNFLGNFRAR